MRPCPSRAARLTAAAGLAVVLVAGGTPGAADARERPAVPPARTFVSHALKDGAELTLRVGGRGVVRSWSLLDACGTTLRGGRLRFEHARLRAIKRIDGSKVALDLRVASGRLVVGEVRIHAAERRCSAAHTVVAGTTEAWRRGGEAVAANAALAHAPVVDWVARDYEERTGLFPGTKATLLRHAARLGVTSSTRFGEHVTTYEAKHRRRGFVATVGASRGTDVRLRISSAGHVDWIL